MPNPELEQIAKGQKREVLLALAVRCEAATGPDRELDVLIGCAVAYVPDQPGCAWAKEDHWQYVPVPRITERIGCADKAGNVAAHWEAPAYTASLDAAMTLVPEHALWTARTLWDEQKTGGYAVVSRYEVEPNALGLRRFWMDEHSGVSATPALALCTAALRALAAQEPDDAR